MNLIITQSQTSHSRVNKVVAVLPTTQNIVAGAAFSTLQVVGAVARVAAGWLADLIGSARRTLILLSALYIGTYRDEPAWQPPLKVGALLAVVVGMFMGILHLNTVLDPDMARLVRVGFVVLVLGVVLYYLGSKIFTIGELLRSFIMRGHWYLMPLLVVLLTIGSLLVVAASNPFVAPFIYTLF